MTTKLSITLPDDTLKALDSLIEERKIPSRSAAIQAAIKQYITPDLWDPYARAMQEWDDEAENVIWGTVAGDGVS